MRVTLTSFLLFLNERLLLVLEFSIIFIPFREIDKSNDGMTVKILPSLAFHAKHRGGQQTRNLKYSMHEKRFARTSINVTCRIARNYFSNSLGLLTLFLHKSIYGVGEFTRSVSDQRQI